ncbi:hypothetical protein EMCRGX_G020374 [Ephydatia muelleri]
MPNSDQCSLTRWCLCSGSEVNINKKHERLLAIKGEIKEYINDKRKTNQFDCFKVGRIQWSKGTLTDNAEELSPIMLVLIKCRILTPVNQGEQTIADKVGSHSNYSSAHLQLEYKTD